MHCQALGDTYIMNIKAGFAYSHHLTFFTWDDLWKFTELKLGNWYYQQSVLSQLVKEIILLIFMKAKVKRIMGKSSRELYVSYVEWQTVIYSELMRLIFTHYLNWSWDCYVWVWVFSINMPSWHWCLLVA